MKRLSDIALLERLVAVDTTSARSNREVAAMVAEYLDAAGLAVEVLPCADPEKVNVLARIGPEVGSERQGLVLCGHLDCVPADEPTWTSDPYVLTEREGRVYGRGSCDMKGFDALAMNVMAEQDAASLKHPLVLLLTADEEIGGLGAASAAEILKDRAPLPRACLIGEPTSLRAIRMHKGHLKMRITVKGIAGHSGAPHLGRNAIEFAGVILQVLTHLRHQLESVRLEASEHFPEVPFPVLNIAMIDGGAALNVIPDECVVCFGVRLLPGQQADEFITMLHAALETDQWKVDDLLSIEIINDNPPLLTEADAPLNRSICSLIDQAETIGASFASDGGILARELDMDCVLFGPGDIGVAHRPDEFLPLDEYARAATMVRWLVDEHCRGTPQ